MTNVDELLAFIFEGKWHGLAGEFEGWARSSRRFRAFADANKTKIRGKLKNARDQGGLKDVRAELETAFLLLGDERLTLEYERYAALKQRGPDFTVTFKTHTPFNVEVRRIRSIEWDEGTGDARTFKLVTVLLDKVGQMPPSIVNVLWLTTERELSEADLLRALGVLREAAEKKVEEVFVRRGYASAADFINQYRRLSGIVLRAAGEQSLWLNPLAKHPAPPELANAMRRLIADSRPPNADG